MSKEKKIHWTDKQIGGTFRLYSFLFQKQGQKPSCWLCHRLILKPHPSWSHYPREVTVTFSMLYNRIFSSALECVLQELWFFTAALQGSWLDSFSFPRLPQRTDRPADLQWVKAAWLQDGLLSASLQSMPPRLAGCRCELPVISPWFPRKSGCESHRPPGGAAPCLVTCPSHAERVFHWRITAVSTPGSLAGWLLPVMEGERWKNQAASGGFVGKGKKFFFLSTHLTFSGWGQIDKRWIWNSLVVQWLGLYTFTAEGVGSIPTRGTKIPQAMQCSQITILIVK